MYAHRTIADRIKEILKVNHMSQKELAYKSGLTESTISYYISGDRIPHSKNLAKLASALNVTADYLLGVYSKNTKKVGGTFCEKTDNPNCLMEQIINYLNEAGIYDVGIRICAGCDMNDSMANYVNYEFVGICHKDLDLQYVVDTVHGMKKIWRYW